MRPGDTRPTLLYVTDASGNPVTGLTLADFTVDAYFRAKSATTHTTYAAAPSLTEIGGGRYSFAWTLPSTLGAWTVRLVPVVATRTVTPYHWEGVLVKQDEDSLYAALASITGSISTTAGIQLGTLVPLALVKNRYRQVAITITDKNGQTVDLSSAAYTNLTMGVRASDQVTAWDAIATVTGDASGTLTITVPETASFYAALAKGGNSVTLFYEVTGDLGGDTSKTVPIIASSPLTITRSEVGA